MWLSSNHPDRPRRRVSHATVVAYVALLVAALGIPATAVATTALVPRKSVGTAQLRNGAVTNPKIRNGAVGTAKIRNNAVTGAKINLSTVNVTRIARRISGRRTVITNPRRSVAYRLANNTYRQPARTVDMYFGSLRARFPAGCRRIQGAGYRFAAVELTVNGETLSSAFAENFGTGRVTTEQGFSAIGPWANLRWPRVSGA